MRFPQDRADSPELRESRGGGHPAGRPPRGPRAPRAPAPPLGTARPARPSSGSPRFPGGTAPPGRPLADASTGGRSGQTRARDDAAVYLAVLARRPGRAATPAPRRRRASPARTPHGRARCLARSLARSCPARRSAPDSRGGGAAGRARDSGKCSFRWLPPGDRARGHALWSPCDASLLFGPVSIYIPGFLSGLVRFTAGSAKTCTKQLASAN